MKDDFTLDDEAAHGTTKQERAADRMDAVIALYARAVGASGEPDTTVLTDMLADVMHWAAARDLEFADSLRVAEGHFDAETDG